MRKEVKRYDPFGYDGLSALMHEDVLGDYVRHEDYEVLLEENQRLRQLTSGKVMNSTMLREFVARDGGLNIGLEGGACALMAQAFGKQLYDSEALNYVEASFESPDYPDLGQITVTVKRESGKTPHQLRKEAEAERDALLAERDALAIRIYNSGYTAGHHDTVEGQFTDIHRSDMATYHAEEVSELIAALQGEQK